MISLNQASGYVELLNIDFLIARLIPTFLLILLITKYSLYFQDFLAQCNPSVQLHHSVATS